MKNVSPRTFAVALLALVIAAGRTNAQTAHAHPDSARIITSDVENFWRVVDTLKPASTREDSIKAMTAYFEAGTPGLGVYFRSKVKKPEAMLFGLGMLPKYYAGVRANT